MRKTMRKTKEGHAVLPNGQVVPVDDQFQPLQLRLEMRPAPRPTIIVDADGDAEWPSVPPVVESMFVLPAKVADLKVAVLGMIEEAISELPERVAKEARAELPLAELEAHLDELADNDDGLLSPVPYATTDIGDGAAVIYRMVMN